MASKSMRDSVPKYLHTKRLTLELSDDHSRPEHYQCLLGSMNNPTAQSRMGDFGITTPVQFDIVNRATRLSSTYYQGLDPDFDFYYLLREGGRNGPLIGGVSLAQRSTSVPQDIGWCVLEKYIGKGYATEAAREFIR